MLKNPLHLHVNLSNTKGRIKYWRQRLNGTYSGDNIKVFLGEFIDKVRLEVLWQYVSTYSHLERNIKRRTYALESALNYSKVYQTSEYGFSADATNPGLYPLGEGSPEYAIFQEFGTIYLPARNFLLAGDAYISEHFQSELDKRLRTWCNGK